MHKLISITITLFLTFISNPVYGQNDEIIQLQKEIKNELVKLNKKINEIGTIAVNETTKENIIQIANETYVRNNKAYEKILDFKTIAVDKRIQDLSLLLTFLTIFIGLAGTIAGLIGSKKFKEKLKEIEESAIKAQIQQKEDLDDHLKLIEYQKGIRLERIGKYDEAKDIFEFLKGQFNLKKVDLCIHIGLCCEGLNQLDAALENLKEAYKKAIDSKDDVLMRASQIELERIKLKISNSKENGS